MTDFPGDPAEARRDRLVVGLIFTAVFLYLATQMKRPPGLPPAPPAVKADDEPGRRPRVLPSWRRRHPQP